jgi:GNAT superfamily N-acetyltransferase
MALTPIPGFEIREATSEDVGLILWFIEQLGEFEKLSHEVVATEETLERSLFGDRRVAEVIIGEYEGEAVCFALFFHNYSTFLARPGLYLEDLFVIPAMRSKGFGRVMLAYLARLALDRGCGRFEWSVLDWNERALKFYHSLGAAPMNDWTVQRIDGKALSRLADELG